MAAGASTVEKGPRPDNDAAAAPPHATSPKSSYVSKIKDAASTAYRKTVVEPLLRRKSIAPTDGGRRVPLSIEHAQPLVDTRRGQSYISNDIRTSRYTVWDFIPKQLFFQFSRVGNFYFLCVGIPQTVCSSLVCKKPFGAKHRLDPGPVHHWNIHHHFTAAVLCTAHHGQGSIRRLQKKPPRQD